MAFPSLVALQASPVLLRTAEEVSPYLFASIANIGFTAALGLYVYRNNSRATVNRIFALTALGQILWSAAILASRIPLLDPAAVLLYEVFGFFPVFLVCLLLHFTLVFCRYGIVERKGGWILPYLPALVVTALIFANMEFYITGVRIYDSGFHLVFGPGIALFYAVMVSITLTTIALVAWSYLRTPPSPERSRRGLLLFGLLVMALSIWTVQVLRQYYDRPMPVTQNDIVLPVSVLWAYLIVRRHLIINPVREEPSPGAPSYRLSPGTAFLVKEERPDLALRVFADLVTHGSHGLGLVRTLPRRIRQTYGLPRTPLVWVGRVAPAEDIQALDHPEGLLILVAKFLEESSDSVVLLDCFEYLLQRYGSPLTFQALYNLREIVARHDARLLVTVNPRALGEQEMSLLEKELKAIGPAPI